MLATIVQGETGWNDVLLLIAVILFAVSTVIRALAHSVDGTLVSAGLCLTALALLAL